MKIKDIKQKLDTLGYDDETEIRLFLTNYGGDCFEINVEDIDDSDRQDGYGNYIDVVLSDPPQQYLEEVQDNWFDNFLEDLDQLILRYR